ncbi:cylX protein [Streptococcus equinus]|uniref:cylX protein n=1 Tax=Streptococcus equinus TaxID=1335 RepID=UPI003BF77F7D
MDKSNILGKNEELSDNQYCLYDTRLANSLLISTHLVGRVYYANEIVEGGTYEKGAVLLAVEILGLTYEYVADESVKILKKYCDDGGIVGYDTPILLVERIKR